MTRGCEWRHAAEACAEDLGRFEKSLLVEIETWARPDEFVRYGNRTFWGWGGGRWKSQYTKMVSLSLFRKTFKLKDNKKFRTWTKKS